MDDATLEELEYLNFMMFISKYAKESVRKAFTTKMMQEVLDNIRNKIQGHKSDLKFVMY